MHGTSCRRPRRASSSLAQRNRGPDPAPRAGDESSWELSPGSSRFTGCIHGFSIRGREPGISWKGKRDRGKRICFKRLSRRVPFSMASIPSRSIPLRRKYFPPELLSSSFPGGPPTSPRTFFCCSRGCLAAVPLPTKLLLCHNVFDHEQNSLKNALTRAVLKRADRFVVQNRTERGGDRLGAPRCACRRDPASLGAARGDPGPRGRTRAARRAGGRAASSSSAGSFGPTRAGTSCSTRSPQRDERSPSAPRPRGRAVGRRRATCRARAPAGVRLELDYLSEDERALWFAACDAVVCPYRHATGSGIAADALAFSRPVIGSAVDGLAGIVEEGRSGLLVPPGDAGALAAAMVRFVREGLGPRLSAGAAHRRAVFTPDAHARRVLSAGGIDV